VEKLEAIDFRTQVPAPIDDENDLVAYVAQCESVLGPIPEISCDPARPAPGTRVTKIPVFVDGHLLAFGGEYADDDAELLSQRQESGEYTCDFPSLGGDFPCGVGSTLIQYANPENPNVQWMGLCRGVPGDTPSYDRFIGNGLIGANELTGEMCFFFGANPDRSKAYRLPRLASTAESAEALSPWLAPRDMPGSCLSCHPNNDPWIQTPWLQPEYMRRVLEDADFPLDLPSGVTLDDVLAARYIRQTPVAHKTLLPEALPPGRSSWTEEEIVDGGRLLKRQYRAVGSSYVSNEAAGTVKARTGTLPASWSINFRDRLLLVEQSQACSRGCHAVANENFERLAKDSLRSAEGSKYYSNFADLSSLHESSWMPPFESNDDAAARTYAGGVALLRAITECPIPKQLSEPPTVSVSCSKDQSDRAQVQVLWKYDNDFGKVPGRDDVRFDVSLAFEGAGVGVNLGVAANQVEGIRMDAGDNSRTIRDVAPELEDLGAYRLELAVPENAGAIVLALQPKRFCFEEPNRRPYAYAKPLNVTVDVRGACR
jgi:hypothetical protein